MVMVLLPAGISNIVSELYPVVPKRLSCLSRTRPGCGLPPLPPKEARVVRVPLPAATSNTLPTRSNAPKVLG